MSKVYRRTGRAKVGYSAFNLSYEKKFTCDMGQLIPSYIQDCVPGDVFKLATHLVIRFQPMVAPLLHEINAYIHYFFVPYRILDEEFEEMITGGVNGNSVLTPAIWAPTNFALGSLWDYMEFPLVDPEGVRPVSYLKWAYNKIYNDYYRDETQIAEVDLDTQEAILNRCWEKDYFTSALPWQQRGTAPALPVSGTLNAQWANPVTLDWPAATTSNAAGVQRDSVSNAPYGAGDKAFLEAGVVNNAELEANTINASGLTTFNVADLRLVFQIQKWLERNARSGARYVEFLGAHFGVHPRDDRLQRPEYIGGMKMPIIISEVLQTSKTETGAPQGNMSGHGIGVGTKFIGKYRCQEFGCIIGILSIMPRTIYQQGVQRQWIKNTKYDFYFPEFANLSEQAIYTGEIYATGVLADNQAIWGYQGRFDEMRTRQSVVVGEMRTTFDYWHMSRQFGAAPDLDQTFLECVPRKDVFTVQNIPEMIVSVGNIVKAIRPIPIMSNPGLIDH